MRNKLLLGDCLELIKGVPGNSIDMIMADLPFGITSCEWDVVIPFETLWLQYKRVIKKGGVIALCSIQPFTSKLILSNLPMFKYQWYYLKRRPTGFQNAKKQPLRNVEDICIFYDSAPTYNPQGIISINKIYTNSKSVGGETIRGDVDESKNKGLMRTQGSKYIQEFTNYPKQTLEFENEHKKINPTQKPVGLFEYLIRTYTNEGDLILDNVMGSGTTAIACIKSNRDFICMEKDEKMFNKANQRIEDYLKEKLK